YSPAAGALLERYGRNPPCHERDNRSFLSAALCAILYRSWTVPDHYVTLHGQLRADATGMVLSARIVPLAPVRRSNLFERGGAQGKHGNDCPSPRFRGGGVWTQSAIPWAA